MTQFFPHDKPAFNLHALTLAKMAAALIHAVAAVLVTAMAFPAAGAELQARDLPPVTRMDAPEHPAVEIVRDRQPRAVVYVADTDPSPTLRRLVDELIEVVRLSTGATLERVDQPPASDRTGIMIGDCEQSRQAGIDAEQIPIEGFVVKTAPNRVYLVGSTKALPPGSTRHARWSNEGTAWAVADFLERFVDVRWYWPTNLGGRTVTRSTSLIVPPVHYRDQPVFRLREYHPRFGWKLPARARSSDQEPLPFPPGAIPEGVETVDMATYLPLIRSGCSWPYKIKVHEPQNLGRRPKEFHEERKKMFAVNKDGTRNYNFLCYSSQNTLDFLLDGCRRVWDEGGAATWVTSTCVTVSPADSPVGCHCPACQKTFAEGGGTRIGGTSLIMAKFAKQMCEAVKQQWPDKKVIYLPYWNYDECREEVQYPDNLVVMSAMTTYPMPLNAQRENFEEGVQRLRDFRSQACVPVTIWDYCVAWTYGPYQYPHLVRDHCQAIKGISAGAFLNGMCLGEWTNTAPTLYVWMKVLWDPDLDVDAVLDEMCRRLYGKAGGTAREFMKLQCDVWEKGQWTKDRIKQPGGWPVPRRLFPVVFTPDVVRQMKTLRNKALAELADDPIARQRFLYWTWTFDAFLNEADAKQLDTTGKGMDRSRLKVAVEAKGQVKGEPGSVWRDFDASSKAIALRQTKPSGGPYTVRLHFADPDNDQPGRRVFDVKLQGDVVLKDFDIVKTTGGRNTAVIREFEGIEAARTIRVELVPKGQNHTGESVLVLSGIEIVAAEVHEER